ncbi:MAG: hypothetical protein ABJF88_09495 [Rhodothermales bacterium]
MPDSNTQQLHVMALLSTLRTASEVRHAMAERRAGRDPSGQEDVQPVRDYLREALPTLRSLVSRLRVSLAVERDERAAFVQAFEDRLTLARLARELHVVHQRLLSLYPDVPPALVEEARLRQQEAARLAVASGSGFDRVLTHWLDRTSTFLEAMAEVLETPN